MISITLVIVILTAIVSFTSMNNQKVINDLIFYPPAITNRNQWYRFFSCALIHADIPHLVFNMWGLYVFGENLEEAMEAIFPGKGKLMFIGLYLFAQFLCLVPTYLKNKDNYHYRSLGASGAVSGVVFASILLFPTAKLGLLFIPIGIPGFIFGFIYLAISYYMAKRGSDNINHEAHFFGALAGVGYLVIACYALTPFDPLRHFAGQIAGFLQ